MHVCTLGNFGDADDVTPQEEMMFSDSSSLNQKLSSFVLLPSFSLLRPPTSVYWWSGTSVTNSWLIGGAGTRTGNELRNTVNRLEGNWTVRSLRATCCITQTLTTAVRAASDQMIPTFSSLRTVITINRKKRFFIQMTHSSITLL